MQVTKVLGLAAVGALLVLAAPTERAQALSLSNPGAAVRCFSRDRTQRAPPPSAPLSLRLSSVLSALLLRAAHLLSAVSLLRAGTIPVRPRLWSVLVMSV